MLFEVWFVIYEDVTIQCEEQMIASETCHVVDLSEFSLAHMKKAAT